MAKKARRNEAKEAPAFEVAMTELETIVQTLEDGEIELETALDRYERGVKLLRHCHTILQKAERRLELLTEVDEEGNAVTTAFSDEEMTLDEKSRRRDRRRSFSSPEDEAPLDDSI